MAGNGKKAGSNGRNGHSNNGEAVRPPHFGSKLISTIPHGRKGKHNLIVSMILDDLEELEPEKAVLIPLAGVEGGKKEKVPPAPNRATREKKVLVTTAPR